MHKPFIIATLAALILTPVHASQKTAPTQATRPALSERLSETRADLVTAAQSYKASLEKLLPFEEDERKRAAEELERSKQILAEGGDTEKPNVQESERRLAAAEVRLAGTQKQLREADVIAEAASGKGLLVKPSETKVRRSVERSKPRPAKKLPPGVKVVKYPVNTAQTFPDNRFNAKSILWLSENRAAGSAATCVGADPCRACKNCRYCARCAKEGKSCGVCKPREINGVVQWPVFAALKKGGACLKSTK